MTTQIEDLVGLTEIAERCNVNKNVASGWTRKHTFPEIKLKLAMGPMWDWNEVQEHLYGVPKMEIKLLDGSAFAYVKRTACMICGSDDIRVTDQGQLLVGPDGAVVEFTYHCNTCQADVDRSVDLTKEDA